MKKFALIMLLTGCMQQRATENAVKAIGGKDPIICLKSTPKYNKMWYCRDAVGSFFVCNTRDECVPITYPAEVFGVGAPIAPALERSP